MPLYHRFLEFAGIERERFHVEWVSAAEGPIFRDQVVEFTEILQNLPPIKKVMSV